MQNFVRKTVRTGQGTTFFIWNGALATTPDKMDDQR